MKNTVFFFILIWILVFNNNAQELKVSDDIKLFKLTENSYIHISYYNSPRFSRFPSNGLLYINNGKAFLFDTPFTNELTQPLVDYIQDSMNIKIIGFVPTHWHNDCMGGLEYIHSKKIPSYGLDLTCNIAKKNKLPVPKKSFKDSLLIKMDDISILCKFYGAGHAQDNIIVWVPYDSLIFGGCLLKALNAIRLGNLSDADVGEWPITIERIIKAYPEVKYIVPGHGPYGNDDLLYQTLLLIDLNNGDFDLTGIKYPSYISENSVDSNYEETIVFPDLDKVRFNQIQISVNGVPFNFPETILINPHSNGKVKMHYSGLNVQGQDRDYFVHIPLNRTLNEEEYERIMKLIRKFTLKGPNLIYEECPDFILKISWETPNNKFRFIELMDRELEQMIEEISMICVGHNMLGSPKARYD